jgi:hypothetical protein
VALPVEVVVDLAMAGSVFLKTSHPPKAKHGPFSPSEWLMGVLGAVVQF